MLLVIIVATLIFALLVLFFVTVVKMANKRGRSGLGWFMLSLVTSPFLAMLILALIGETEAKRKERIIEEEELRNLYRNPSNSENYGVESDLEKWSKNNPGMTLNDYYKNRK